MKKLVLLLILMLPSISAMIGVTPVIYNVDFQPNFEQQYTFYFITDASVKLEIYSEGDLAEYVTLDKESIQGSEYVIAYLKLPKEIDIPGTHDLFIGAKQPYERQGGIGIAGNVRGIIRVKVPYPGEYLEASILTNNANLGEDIEIKVTVDNLGKNDVNADVSLQVYNSQKTESFYLGNREIKTTESAEFIKTLSTLSYKAGDYNLTAIVNYAGKQAKAISYFRLGELFVNISNYTGVFEKNKINRMEIEAESYWNEPITNLFANITLPEYNINFVTPSLTILPWEKAVLTGFFDTSIITNDTFDAIIELNYGDKKTTRTAELTFAEEKSKINSVYISIAIIIILLIIIFSLSRKRKKK